MRRSLLSRFHEECSPKPPTPSRAPATPMLPPAAAPPHAEGRGRPPRDVQYRRKYLRTRFCVGGKWGLTGGGRGRVTMCVHRQGVGRRAPRGMCGRGRRRPARYGVPSTPPLLGPESEYIRGQLGIPFLLTLPVQIRLRQTNSPGALFPPPSPARRGAGGLLGGSGAPG